MKVQEFLEDSCMRVGQVHTLIQATAWRIHIADWLDRIKLEYIHNTQAGIAPVECISKALCSLKGMINEGKRETATCITRYVFDEICSFVDTIKDHAH